jgi:hypothetical protein
MYCNNASSTIILLNLNIFKCSQQIKVTQISLDEQGKSHDDWSSNWLIVLLDVYTMLWRNHVNKLGNSIWA